ncbi:MAG: FAD-binding oxidoreductase, partial [Pirellulales bacterium]
IIASQQERISRLAERATLGGVIATNWSGPRRYGYGTIRDYVIGIRAVDGRGRPFQGGGRVVKNVAGYDFCKLLVGSLGTLGVITQVTLKVKPLAEATSLLAWDLPDWDTAERVLGSLVNSAATPSAIELVSGSAWLGPEPSCVARLALVVEGDDGEVSWMIDTLDRELEVFGLRRKLDRLPPQLADLVEFSARDGSPLVVKVSARPSQVVALARLALELDPKASIQAHAGSGILLIRFSEIKPQMLSRHIIGKLQPAARAAGGNAVIVAATGAELTRQSVWGHLDEALDVMREVKRAFDPANILNRGRFVF